MHRRDISTEQIPALQRWLEEDVLSEKAKVRLRCILQYFQSGTSLEETAAQFHVAANSLRRWLVQFDPNDPTSLEEKSRRRHTVQTSSVTSEVALLIKAYRVQFPQMGKMEIAEKLLSDHHVSLSPSSIGRVIERDCLYFSESALHRRKRFQKGGVPPLAPVIHSTAEPKPVRTGVSVQKWVLAAAVLALAFTGYELRSLRASTLPRDSSQCTESLNISTADDTDSLHILRAP